MYSNQVPLSKAALALNERMFNRHSFFFLSDYAAKISSKAQWERFLMKIGGGAAKRAEATRPGPRSSRSTGTSDRISAKEGDTSPEASCDFIWQPSDSVQANIFDVADSDSTW